VNLPAAAMVDLSFVLHGRTLPRDHRLRLADALAEALPGLGDDPRVAVLPVKLVSGDADPALLSARSRLVVRIPRETPSTGSSTGWACPATRSAAANNSSRARRARCTVTA
jgi:hypothetical protein